ncbi:MAG: RagB/SusD family nutrient uptake outer membrane protein [Prevotellaceae bacterium]|jgi:hypothetical protein|nr:RagB/SusD family nutrient uptake outer membrane protein [Prevotellaceae bacterium]
MKKIFLLLVIAVMCFTSCEKYLDLVPDDVTKIEDLFTTKTDALNALAKIYSFLPVIDDIHETPFLLGDEYICSRVDLDNAANRLIAQRVMRNLQSSGSPLMGIWSGTGGVGDSGEGKHYYVAMRHCELVIEHVDLVHDMTEIEKEEMKAQVKFLKAYYAFMLIKQYGPIVLPQYMDTDETDPEKLFPKRVTIDESFDYVVNLMKEAIPQLRTKVSIADYGQVDQTVAKSILARVLVFRASPFFNGNSDIYGTFRNSDGTFFFPQTYDKEKWKDALDALDDAIATCTAAGIKLYEYSKPTFYNYDSAFVNANPTRAQMYYDRRFVITDPWNTELIWGRSDYLGGKGSNDNRILANACNIRLPDDPDYEGAGYSERNNNMGCGQTMSASYQMLERYYTENGLPIDEDLTYADDEKYRLATIPELNNPEYSKYNGLMQPGHQVIKLLMNRELRFYTDLIITGGYARTHRYKVRTSMFRDTDGGMNTSNNQGDYFCTGIGIQKMVHPESSAGWGFIQVRYPCPYIRLADLYLMRAEARNEYYGPGPEVWEDINLIRRRAGIREVQDVWADPQYAKTLNKHQTQLGLREIILDERAIELSFEGIHYWDMVRYKKAVTEFSQPITGWNVYGQTAADFFILLPIEYRRFPLSSYLWPISVDEMNINGSLVNNPGWE